MRTILLRGRYVLLLLFLLGLVLRLPGALVPPTRILYNVDETYLVYSTLGLFVGLPPTSLVWPAGTLLFALFPIYGADMLLHVPLHAVLQLDVKQVLDQIAGYVADGFYDPTRLLVMGRVFVVLFASLTSPLFYVLSRDLIGRRGRLFAAGLIAVSPLAVQYGYILKADAIAQVFWIAAFCCYLRALTVENGTHNRFWIASAILTGLAVSSLSIYVLFLPLLFGSAVVSLVRTRKVSRLQVLKIFAGMALGFLVPVLIFVPFLWISLIAFLKSAMGVPLAAAIAWRKLGSNSVGTLLFTVLPSLLGYIGLGFAMIGGIAFWFKGRRTVALASLLVLVLFGLPVASSGFIYDRYGLPLLPVLALWAGMGLDAMSHALVSRPANVALTVTMDAALLLILLPTVLPFQPTHLPTARTETVNWLEQNLSPETPFAVPADFALAIPPNQTALARLVQRYAESKSQQSAARANQLLERVGRAPAASSYPNSFLDGVFGQTEAQDQFRYEMMYWRTKQGGAPSSARNVFYYAREPDTLDILPTAQVWAMLQRGEIQAVVATMDDAKGFAPARCFREQAGALCYFAASSNAAP